MGGRTEGIRMASDSGRASAFSLEVEPDAENVRTARLFAASIARHFGVDVERVEDLKVAVSEAVTNSVKAHRSAGIADPIRVAATVRDEGLQFSVIDAGSGFDLDAVPTDSTSTPPSGLYRGSLGLTLIKTLFPDVEISRNSGDGMTVSFVIESGRSSALVS